MEQREWWLASFIKRNGKPDVGWPSPDRMGAVVQANNRNRLFGDRPTAILHIRLKPTKDRHTAPEATPAPPSLD
jgi:hypothetical protein